MATKRRPISRRRLSGCPGRIRLRTDREVARRRTSGRIRVSIRVNPAAETVSEGAPAEAGSPQAETAAEGGPQRNTLRLRNWRRRHRTMRTVPRLGEAGGGPPSAENGAAEAIANAVIAAAPGDSAAPRPHPRRRRPRYPIPERPPGESGEIAAGE